MDSDLFKAFAEEFTKEFNRLRSDRSSELNSKRGLLGRIDNQIDKLVTAIADGADALALNSKLKTLERRKEEIEREIGQGADDPVLLLHPNLAELYRRKIVTLSELLDDPEAKEEAFEIIRSMISEVCLTPDGDTLRIELKGELAGILDFCEKSKKPGQNSRSDAEQIKMVAGAGNHRELTLKVDI